MTYSHLIKRIGSSSLLREHVFSKFQVVEKQTPSAARFQAKILRCWKQIEDKIYFPRMMMHKPIFEQLIETREHTEPAPIRQVTEGLRLTEFEFFQYQTLSAEFAVEQFKANKHAVYLQAPTGCGKTFIAINTFLLMKVPMLFVAQTLGLSEQFRDDLLEVLPGVRVLQYDNAQAEKALARGKPAHTFENYDVIIVVNKTLAAKDPAFFKGCGLAIADEAHTYTSATNTEIMWHLQAVPHILAMSATPNSASSKLDVFPTRFFGEYIPITSIAGVTLDDVVFDVKVKKIEYYGDITKPWCQTVYTATIAQSAQSAQSAQAAPATQTSDLMSAINTIESISHDPLRNLLLVDEIVRLRDAGHGVLVFFELRDHLEQIRTILSRIRVEVIDGDASDTVSILKGGVAKDAITTTRKAGIHVVLTTYGYCRFGISLVEMTALVFASPRRNGTEQQIGRVMRRGSDYTITREIVDVCDMNVGLKSQYYTRSKIYKMRNYPINTVKVKFDEVKTDLTFREISEEIANLAADCTEPPADALDALDASDAYLEFMKDLI